MSTAAKPAPIPPSRQREKPGQTLKWIGKSIKRVEDPRLLTGQGRYIDDIDLPKMLHAAVLRSSRPHARIKSIDTARRVGAAGRGQGVDRRGHRRHDRGAAVLCQSDGRTTLCRGRIASAM